MASRNKFIPVGTTAAPYEVTEQFRPTPTNGDGVGVPLPVRGGRQTHPEGLSNVGTFIAELAFIEPDFPVKLLEAMETLAKYHGDVSLAVENIVALGNTPYKIEFDDKVPDTLAKEMRARIKEREKEWYTYSGGVYSLINDLLAQGAIFGCVSAENIPSKSLDGINRVALVTPKHIRFRYDTTQDLYVPYQAVPTGLVPTADLSGMIKLNTTTYKYLAMRRFSEKPYPIPPFLSALYQLSIERDMMENFKYIVKKLGVLGFLEVLINAPAKKQGEDDAAYISRSRQYLDFIVPEVEKGMSKGYVTGFKNTHEFNMHNTSGNVQGSKTLMDINDVKVMAGLKQDPFLLGRNMSTTETLGRVILAKMTAQVSNYQVCVATFLSYLFLTDLQLAGYKVKAVDVTFEKAMVGDKLRDAQAYTAEIANAETLYKAGIISQTTKAQLVGYEKPDQEEPRQDPLLLAAADAANAGDGTDATKQPGKTDPAKAEDKKKKDAAENTRLLDWQIESMSNYPENGAGYHVVDFWLRDGSCRQAVVVLNGETINDDIDVNEVTSILHVPSLDLTDLAQYAFDRALGNFPQFEYESPGCNCGVDHEKEGFGKKQKHSNSIVEEYMAAYSGEVGAKFKKSVQSMTKKIGEKLLLLGENATEQEVTDMVMYTLYKDWGITFTKKLDKVISKFVNEVYTFFRKDKAVFGATGDVPAGVFNTIDFRALDYYKASDQIYLGKFITDEDLKKQITQYLKDEYLNRNLPIGNNTKALDKFKEKFGDIMDGQDWKLQRVIDTSVNRMRNSAAMNYLDQAGVEKFEIVGVTDRLQCSYCKNLQGKTFTVSKSITALDRLMKTDPQSIASDSPFITAIFKKPADMEGLSGDELQDKGFNLLPAHCFCRDTFVAV